MSTAELEKPAKCQDEPDTGYVNSSVISIYGQSQDWFESNYAEGLEDNGTADYVSDRMIQFFEVMEEIETLSEST